MNPELYTHSRVLAAPGNRVTPEDAIIARLATKAQALAEEYGETLSREAAIQRARENLEYVRALAGGVK